MPAPHPKSTPKPCPTMPWALSIVFGPKVLQKVQSVDPRNTFLLSSMITVVLRLAAKCLITSALLYNPRSKSERLLYRKWLIYNELATRREIPGPGPG